MSDDGPKDPFDDDESFEGRFDDDAFDEDGADDDAFDGDEDLDDLDVPLDAHESELVAQDLTDLADFEATFRGEGFRGVAVWCHDCVEEHYFPWDMLRENLQLLLETGETPVHEPAYQPEPDRYVPWDYARGYVDALRDVGVTERLDADACPRCDMRFEGPTAQANFCPRCGTSLLADRLASALRAAGLADDEVDRTLRAAGLPRRA